MMAPSVAGPPCSLEIGHSSAARCGRSAARCGAVLTVSPSVLFEAIRTADGQRSGHPRRMAVWSRQRFFRRWHPRSSREQQWQPPRRRGAVSHSQTERSR
jgi:hypothetical protein